MMPVENPQYQHLLEESVNVQLKLKVEESFYQVQKVLFNIPLAFRKDNSVAVEPRLDSSHNRTSNDVWTQPQVVKVETHCITSQQHQGACYN